MEPSLQFCFEVRDVMRWREELAVGRRVLVWFADGKITLDVGADSFGPYRWDGRRGRIKENLPLCDEGSTLYPLYQDIIEEKIREILAAAERAAYQVIHKKQKVKALEEEKRARLAEEQEGHIEIPDTAHTILARLASQGIDLGDDGRRFLAFLDRRASVRALRAANKSQDLSPL